MRVLRTFVDCLAVGGDIAQESALDLAEVARGIHEQYSSDEAFVFVHLGSLESEAGRRFSKHLALVHEDPLTAKRQLETHLRFDELLPEECGEDHRLFEDALSRAAVVALLKGDRRTAATFARGSLVFRLPSGSALAPAALSPERARAAEAACQEAQSEITPLLHLSRDLLVRARQFGRPVDSEHLHAVHSVLQELYQIFSHREPWVPMSYPARGELVATLVRACSPELEIPAPLFEVLAGMKTILNVLTPLSPSEVAEIMLVSRKTLSEPFFAPVQAWLVHKCAQLKG